jgi:hypothetical protein
LIVLSYRRADSPGFARALRERLVQEFGAERVFLDVETIDAGADFRERLRAAVETAEALVVIIGREWLAPDASGMTRLHEPGDPVRLEIATALKNDVRVLPVLVDGAVMPSAAALPADLRALADRNAVVLGNERFDADLERLLEALGAGSARRTRRRTIAFAALLFLAAVVIVGVVALQRGAEAPFTLEVQVSATDGSADIRGGELLLRLGRDERTRALDESGTARFDGIPAAFRDVTVTLIPRVAGYDTTAHTVRLSDPSVTLALRRQAVPSVLVRGTVLDARGRAVAGVQLDFDNGLATAVSDSTGHFTATIPKSAGALVTLRATKDDAVGYHDTVTLPASTALVVRFRPGG